jgi:toxin YoeB
MNDFTFTAKGFSDYLYWQGQDKKVLKKINSLLADIRRNGVMEADINEGNGFVQWRG